MGFFFGLIKGSPGKMLMMLHLNTKGRTDKDTDRSFGSQGSLKDLEMAIRKEKTWPASMMRWCLTQRV